jgi:hypothetical protein
LNLSPLTENQQRKTTMRLTTLTIAFAVSLTSGAMAGDVSGRGPNGGKVADAPNMHIEFVSKGTEIAVYTYDHNNKPVSSSGMSGRVTVQEGGKTRTADLAAAEPNQLTGKLEAPLIGGARVIVSLTPKGGKPFQARYTAN